MGTLRFGTIACTGVLLLSASAGASDVVGLDVRADNETFTSSTTDFVGDFTITAVVLYDSFAMDMDVTATVLYAVLFDGANTYGTIDIGSGAFTPLGTLTGPAAADNVAGLSVDPTTGTWYIIAIDVAGLGQLWSGDITTGIFTLVGPTGFNFNIDLAIDSQGNAYSHDIATDELLSINLGTGAGAAIGLTGVNANFAQGMDFDYTDDTLYATLYTGGGTGSFGTFNTATGAYTPLQDTLVLNSEMEVVVAEPLGVACPWDCGDGNDIVGTADLLALLAQWGVAGPCDFDGGGVGTSDLLKLLANWGACP